MERQSFEHRHTVQISIKWSMPFWDIIVYLQLNFKQQSRANNPLSNGFSPESSRIKHRKPKVTHSVLGSNHKKFGKQLRGRAKSTIALHHLRIQLVFLKCCTTYLASTMGRFPSNSCRVHNNKKWFQLFIITLHSWAVRASNSKTPPSSLLNMSKYKICSTTLQNLKNWCKLTTVKPGINHGPSRSFAL